MGYNIEVSFNIRKVSSVTELQESVKNLADKCGCCYYYEDYEFETHSQFNRNHCLITINFSQTAILSLLEFLKFIRSKNELYLETIYDEKTNTFLYASQYYITQKMDKGCAKIFIKERRKRSYSEDENMILNTIKK